MLNTSLTELRRRSPRYKTHAELVVYFAKRGLARKVGLFGAFERGQIKNPPERFIQLWAEALGVPVENVLKALTRTQRQRERGTGPFAPARRVPRPSPRRNSKKLLTT